MHASGVPPTFDWQLPPGHCDATLQFAPGLVPPTHAFSDAQSLFAAQPWNVPLGPQNCSNGPPVQIPASPVMHDPPGHSEAALHVAF